MRTLLFVESNTTGTGRLFARRARELGVEPVLVTAEPARYPYAAADGVRTVQADTADPAAVLAVAGNPAGVMTSSEYALPVAAEVAHRLGLPGPDPAAVLACRDKALQRAALHVAGVPVPAFARASSVPAAVAVAERLGYPVVVKPVEGSGSVGVRLCPDATAVAGHTAALLAVTHNERGLPVPARVLVERYADGVEFSVELFGDQVVAIVRKYLGPEPHFAEIGHDLPAGLGPASRRSLGETARRAIAALGLGFGAAHVEIRCPAGGPVLVEVNARPAGGMIPELVRAATGVDLLGAQLAAVLGRRVRLAADRDRHAALRFLTVERHSVVRAAAVGDLPSIVDVQVYREPGTPVRPAEDYRDRIGHVLAVADDARTCREAAVAGLGRLRSAVVVASSGEGGTAA
jgi:biotin carboxylase